MYISPPASKGNIGEGAVDRYSKVAGLVRVVVVQIGIKIGLSDMARNHPVRCREIHVE